MAIKDAIKTVEKAGTKMAKDKLLDTIRRTASKEFSFVRDPVSGMSVVLMKPDKS